MANKNNCAVELFSNHFELIGDDASISALARVAFCVGKDRVNDDHYRATPLRHLADQLNTFVTSAPTDNKRGFKTRPRSSSAESQRIFPGDVRGISNKP